MVVGAGAAGLLAALAARGALGSAGDPRSPGPGAPSVLLVDSMERPARKILVSGGGRCNLTNARVDEGDFLASRPGAVRCILREFPPPAIRSLLASLGVPTRVEAAGRVFPAGGMRARHVREALLRAVRDAGVVQRFGWEVGRVEREEGAGGAGAWILNGEVRAARVVIATGGRSLPRTGSRGFGHDLARGLGHRLREPRPALAALACDPVGPGAAPVGLAGLTVPALLSLASGARVAGSLLFTHQGVSGPAPLDASLHLCRLSGRGLVLADFWTLTEPGGPWERYRGLPKPPGACLRGSLTPPLAPDLALASVERFLLEHARREGAGAGGGGGTLAAALAERLPRRLIAALLPGPPLPMARLTREERRGAGLRVTRFPLRIRAIGGFDRAEVTCGGVPLEELDRRTLESRIAPGLHFCGEVVDVTGRLGGFNFQWAWSSGYVAGRAADPRLTGPGAGGTPPRGRARRSRARPR